MWTSTSWFKRLFPHAEALVAERLRARRQWRKLANYLWVEFLLARASTRLWGGKPYWLTIDPTNFCQLQCPFCPTGANRGVRDKATMDFAHFERFMEAAGPCAVHIDFMNWGESLLNKRLPEMIAVAKRYGAEVKLDANLNDASAQLLERLVLSRLDCLSVSVDGLTQQTYGRYRVGGRLDRVLANLKTISRLRRELNSATPLIIFQFLVFRHNEHEVPQVEAFARAHGADRASLVSPFMPSDPAYLWEWMAKDERWQMYRRPESAPPAVERELAARAAHVKNIPAAAAFHARRFKPAQTLRLSALCGLLRQARLPRDCPRIVSRLLAAVLDARRKAAIPYRGEAQPLCKWPWAGLALNPDGAISPCCSVEDQNDDFGNAFQKGLGAIWNGRLYRRARRHVARYAAGRAAADPAADHVCERCTAIGHANFRFPPVETVKPAERTVPCA